MALLTALTKLNTVQSFEDAFKATDITSQRMQTSIAEWFNLYFDTDGDCDTDPSQRIPYVVVDGLHKAVFGEYGYSIDETTDKGKKMATALQGLDKIRPEAFQQTLIGGEGFLKPIIRRDNFRFSYINRMNFVVLGRDIEGNITSVGTSQVTAVGKYFYTLLEKRTVDDDGYVTIESKLFKSDAEKDIGVKTPLTDLPQYADIPPIFTLPLPLDNLGLIPIKTPMANSVDGSKDGVGVYGAAAKKIQTQYGHEQRTEDEYELTSPSVLMSDDLFPNALPSSDFNDDPFMNRRKRVAIPKYVKPVIDGDSDSTGLTLYNPTPNQVPLESRANQNMRDIENIIGLRRGILSSVENEDKTATEVITSSGRYALTIHDFQVMWSTAVQETVRTCNILGQMYLGWDTTEPPPAEIAWGNGVLYDEQQDYERLRALVADGHLKAEYLLKWMELKSMPPEEMATIRRDFMPGLADVE